MSALEELANLLKEAQETQKRDVVEVKTDELKTLAEFSAQHLGQSKTKDVTENVIQDPLDNRNFVTFKDMNDHYSLFLSRIQRQLESLGGGGEVNFRYLDDVNRSTMETGNDNHVLEYDASTGKVQFTTNVGPIETLMFDTSYTGGNHSTGTLYWNNDDETLNLYHPNNVVQQIGQEIYGYVRNNTGSVIPDGTFVQFAGAEQNGNARLEIMPMLADGTYPSLYGFGVTTQEFQDGEDGHVTVWGKIQNINASGTNFANTANHETWSVGDILYASPIEAGKLTNVKPTAPNNVIPVAAVLNNSETEGEIFVRPTIEQQQYYGKFSRTTDLTAQNPNEGYPISFDTVDISNGVTLVSGNEIHVVDSGFYQFDFSAQVTATSNKGRVHFWLRKNGVNIPNTSHITTVTNGDTFNISFNTSISLDANDYVEVYWLRTAAGIVIDAIPAAGDSPETAASTINVFQIQL